MIQHLLLSRTSWIPVPSKLLGWVSVWGSLVRVLSRKGYWYVVSNGLSSLHGRKVIDLWR